MARRVVIASANPVKINAARRAFALIWPEEVFEFEGVEVDSGVSAQPMSDDETRQGSINRVNAAQTAQPTADFWVGIEGGSEERVGEIGIFAWITVKSGDTMSHGRTSEFFLPHRIKELMREGKELKEATDIVFQTHNSGQKNGAVGWLTGDIVTRTDFYEQAAVLALIPFKNPELYG